MNTRMIKDFLRLKFDGDFSHDRIAASLGISKGVVTKYIGLAGAAGLDWAIACEMDEAGLERRLLGKPSGPAAYAHVPEIRIRNWHARSSGPARSLRIEAAALANQCRNNEDTQMFYDDSGQIAKALDERWRRRFGSE
jgi:hypothetical protein